MEAKEINEKISSIEKEIYDNIVNTEHWIFYWITNKEVQDFIKEYPEDYDDRVHLKICHLSGSPQFLIEFDEHPDDIPYIERYAFLSTFRNAVKARWLEWKGDIKKLQIKEKEEELLYYKNKIIEIEKNIEELKKK